MASVRTNIINALGWFYDRLTKKDLDPMRESIEELAYGESCLKTELDNVFSNFTSILANSSSTAVNIDDLHGIGLALYWVNPAACSGTHPVSGSTTHYYLLVIHNLQIATIYSTGAMHARVYANNQWYSWS